MTSLMAVVWWIGSLLLSFSSRFQQTPNASESPKRCEQELYAGLDSRIEPHIVGIVPPSDNPVVGFELVRHRPFVARSDQLLGFDQANIAKLTVHGLKGISVNDKSDLLIQTDRGIQTLGQSELETNTELTSIIHGRLYNSGNPVFLEARSHDQITQFVARTLGGRSLLIASFKGTFSAASWNEIGLAAVVGNSLYVWESGSKKIVRLLTDSGLKSAKDVVLIGPGRVIVTLRKTVILVTTETILIIASLPSARCRFDAGMLYILDGQSRFIWALKGLDQLGSKTGDRSHALDLLKHMPDRTDESSTQFLEAARILGCSEARREVANVAPNGSASRTPDN
jgi:hypothetical protein